MSSLGVGERLGLLLRLLWLIRDSGGGLRMLCGGVLLPSLVSLSLTWPMTDGSSLLELLPLSLVPLLLLSEEPLEDNSSVQTLDDSSALTLTFSMVPIATPLSLLFVLLAAAAGAPPVMPAMAASAPVRCAVGVAVDTSANSTAAAALTLGDTTAVFIAVAVAVDGTVVVVGTVATAAMADSAPVAAVMLDVNSASTAAATVSPVDGTVAIVASEYFFRLELLARIKMSVTYFSS